MYLLNSRVTEQAWLKQQ